MLIHGFEKTTLIDYPDNIAAIVFTGGCNFRCDYCYNSELARRPKNFPRIDQEEVIRELDKRKHFIDGLVITGGEPTLQRDLLDFIYAVRALGLKIKLDSNGYNPDILARLFEKKVIDYIAMDIKAPLDRYAYITDVPVDTNKVQTSIQLIMNAGIAYEFRTTVWQEDFSIDDFKKIASLIAGADHYYLQNMYPQFSTPPQRSYTPMNRKQIEPILQLFRQSVKQCALRGTWR